MSLPLSTTLEVDLNGWMSQESVRLEIEAVVRHLVTEGTPDFIARIKAASIVMERRKNAPDRSDAMVSHCLES